MTDAVEKVGLEQAPSNNRIERTGFLNRCCAVGLDLESMFRARTPKIVFQQYRHEADPMTSPTNFRCSGVKQTCCQGVSTSQFDPKQHGRIG
jgi:hypothetical protein